MALLRNQHEVLEVKDVASAKIIVQNEEPDLAIVDWMLPDISGIDFIRWLHRQKSIQNMPVIMLTTKNQEADTITGPDAGADDYMSKPVSIPELLARIRALGRRPGELDSDAHLLQAGPIVVDTAKHLYRNSCSAGDFS